MKEYMMDPNHDPRLILIAPMVKATHKILLGVQEFLKQEDIADLAQKDNGWYVLGASKRGWTAWLVGAVTCPSCVNIKGLAPLVPIMPNLREELHRMWTAYQGFSFAFQPYMDTDLIKNLDEDYFIDGLKKN